MREQTNVCKALAAMVRDHGSPSQAEVRFVARAALELGLDEPANEDVQKVLREGAEFDPIISDIASVPMRRYLFRQVVTAALLDDQINEKERSFIQRTARAFEFDDGVVNDFIRWVREGIEWERRGAGLMERL